MHKRAVLYFITTLSKLFKSKFIPLCVLGLALQGCETLQDDSFFKVFSTQTKNDPVEVISQTPNLTKLDQASTTAAHALATLSRIESAKTPLLAAKAPGLIPDILKQPVTIDWTGPLDGVAQRLATLARYEFQVIGKTPAVPVIIHLASKDIPLIEAFKNTGQQAGTRALLRIDTRRSKVEIIYEN
ncbi:DotD/TraH family lipoprotein [Kiloniella sp.]|uniref:DotD/TraH family lipoprotein n=1 Tax=Kiloniella sp. TaxID=1938587 RepID=UPI003B027D84